MPRGRRCNGATGIGLMADDFAGPASDAVGFPPTLAAALSRLQAVRPSDYARTRNALDGAVTRLSPYLSHGLLSLPQAHAAISARHPLDPQHKLVYEFGWREYSHHAWAHRGAAILASLHPGPLPEHAYADTLPADIREGRTGVPAIDCAVRELYASGYLHNHARMWLASYVVHLRKVHWRAGADWLYAHLLDGDLASNHLGWQWVAGTASHKPYFSMRRTWRNMRHRRGTVRARRSTGRTRHSTASHAVRMLPNHPTARRQPWSNRSCMPDHPRARVSVHRTRPSSPVAMYGWCIRGPCAHRLRICRRTR
jgi:Deoxyribodipyrimidine photolyase